MRASQFGNAETALVSSRDLLAERLRHCQGQDGVLVREKVRAALASPSLRVDQCRARRTRSALHQHVHAFAVRSRSSGNLAATKVYPR
jgi:molybdopterin biosynthesis enzyme